MCQARLRDLEKSTVRNDALDLVLKAMGTSVAGIRVQYKACLAGTVMNQLFPY